MYRLLLIVLLAVGAATVPDFMLNDLEGRALTLRQHRGRVVLVNFWATWCAPCRKEIPPLMELQKQFGTRLVVLSVAMDEEGVRTVAPWVRRERFVVGGVSQPMNYTVLIGSPTVADAYRVEALPATFLVSRDGREVRRIDGPFELHELERAVVTAITER